MSKIEVSMPLYEARLSLTGRCNHKCIYCGPFSDGKADKGYGELALTQIKKLIPLLRTKGLHIQLTGGEPTLRNDLIEIIRTLKDSGIEDIGLTTNGSRIDPEYAQKLVAAGLADTHIHIPSLDERVFEKTTQDKRRGMVARIKQTALYLKQHNQGIEFNTPITPINKKTVPQLIDFCHANRINLKLIEEVSLNGSQVKEEEIVQIFEDWFKVKGLELDETRVDKRYGRIYDLEDFSFRVAPATKGLVDFLTGKGDRILYDGRYWIGGREGDFMFTPTCFLEPRTGDLGDLERNLNATEQIYQE